MSRTAFEIAYPAFDFGMVIEQLSALKFFAFGSHIANNFLPVDLLLFFLMVSL
jgi:hypothetical protein